MEMKKMMKEKKEKNQDEKTFCLIKAS